MPLSRVFQAVALQEGAVLRLEEKASHHLARVLRAAKGDHLILFNGEGGEYDAVITGIDKKGVTVEIQQFNPREAESPIRFCLAQGIARNEKMDWIIQKAVELGVHTIVPLITERCHVKRDATREEKRLQHWHSVMISACEQSGRNRLPQLASSITLQAWVPQVNVEHRFILSPYALNQPLPTTLPANTTIALMVGPEGGFSDNEITFAQQHRFQPLYFGPRILRTETAGLAALAALQYRYGDLSCQTTTHLTEC